MLGVSVVPAICIDSDSTSAASETAILIGYGTDVELPIPRPEDPLNMARIWVGDAPYNHVSTPRCLFAATNPVSENTWVSETLPVVPSLARIDVTASVAPLFAAPQYTRRYRSDVNSPRGSVHCLMICSVVPVVPVLTDVSTSSSCSPNRRHAVPSYTHRVNGVPPETTGEETTPTVPADTPAESANKASNVSTNFAPGGGLDVVCTNNAYRAAKLINDPADATRLNNAMFWVHELLQSIQNARHPAATNHIH